MEKITKKELNIKKDYICINVYHERYSADMCMQIYKNKSILEILQDHHCCEEIDISKIERQGYHGMGYAYDCCGRYDLDKYSLTKKECKRFKSYDIDAQFIVELNTFIREECFNCTFMETNKKFGLVDFAETPCGMSINKNIFSKMNNYLYNNSKIYKKIKHLIWKI